jgi:hypothetical protein
MTIKGLYRVALALGFVAASAVSVEAAQTYGTTNEIDNTEVHVMNNHLVAVRVYAEDSDGKLHRLGRLTRGGSGLSQCPPSSLEPPSESGCSRAILWEHRWEMSTE